MLKFIAICRGYRAAYDVEDGRLVVHNERTGQWFYSWRDAALAKSK